MPDLRSERLTLRPLSADDADDYAALRGDLRTRTYSRSGVPVPDEDARQELAAAVSSWREHGYGHWAITDSAGRFLGVIVVQATGDPTAPELGWVLVPEAWGQGIATEAARLATTDLFARTNVARVTSYLLAANAASRRVAEKIGMRLLERGTDARGRALEVYELCR